MNARHWHAGMKVVFVGYPVPTGIFSGDVRIKRVTFLTIGSVYTILDIGVRNRFASGKWAGPSIYVGCEDPTYGPVWHHHSGFRRVHPRKADISVFTSILTGTKKKVSA